MERDEASALAAVSLKKLLAARGKLQGNFYFVTDASGAEAVLVATLVSKDKKGTRALNQGRPFRKELKGSLYARGSITFEKGKMVFTIEKGTAKKKNMVQGLRTTLSKEKGLGFLKKAVVTTGAASEEELSADLLEGEAVDNESLQEADQSTSSSELDALVEAQGDLSGLSDFFQRSDEELEAAFAEEVGSALRLLQAARQKTPLDETAQAEAWAELASLVAVGHDNLPQLGQDLPPEVFETLRAADALIRGSLNEEQQQQDEEQQPSDEDQQKPSPSLGEGEEQEEEGEEEERGPDLGAQLLRALQQAEQRYFAAGEPEGVAPWILQAERLQGEGAYPEGLALLEKEVAWRLEQAERNQSVQEEIAQATGGGRVELGRLLVEWQLAESKAREQLIYFQNLVLTDPEVTNDPRFSSFEPRVKALGELLPSSEGVRDALNDYITTESAEERSSFLGTLSQAVKAYAGLLDADPRLRGLDTTAFGPVAVYQSLHDAVAGLQSHLSTASVE